MIKKIFKSWLYFFISITFFPLGSFLLPYYKLKHHYGDSLRERAIVNGSVILGLWILDINYVYLYVGIFLVIELLFYLGEGRKLMVFDKIILISIVTSLIGVVYIKFVMGGFPEVYDKIRFFYDKGLNLDKEGVTNMLEIIKANYILIIFVNFYIINYFIYYIIFEKFYEWWQISYQWVIIYIGVQLLKTFWGIENIYLDNLSSIVELIYIIYGIKVVFYWLTRFIERKRSYKLIGIGAAILMPKVIFILGVVSSFQKLKIIIRRKN